MRFAVAVLFLFLAARPAFADFAAAQRALEGRRFEGAFAACKVEAAAGGAACQNLLGYLYAEGLGVPRRPVRAVRLFRRAAAQGYLAAEDNLGRAYELGVGVGKDAATAALWYGKAAARKYPKAQNHLAILYAEGKGVARDPRRAEALFRRAALSGFAPAAFNLGLALEEGRGVPRDLVGAYIWLSIAARPSSPPSLRAKAAVAARRVGERLPARKRADARARALSWRPGQGDPLL